MRILQLHTPYRESGGEDAVVEAERRLLAAAGHSVYQHLEPNPESSVGAVGALAASPWNVASARRVRRSIERHRPDVVHVHNTWYKLSPSVVAAARDCGVPVVMTIHNYRLACVNSLFLREGRPCEECLDKTPFAAVRHRCYRASRPLSAVAATNIAVHQATGVWRRHVDRYIVLSAFARQTMRRVGLPDSRMTLGSNFVADPGTRPRPPSMSDEVLFVGRLAVEKGVPVLLDAWRRCAPQGLRLVVLGSGPLEAELVAAAPPGVEFLGRVEPTEVMARLRRARALVIPSVWYEGQPMVALEGLAAGTPLILSRLGGLPEIMDSCDAGAITTPNDVGALGDALSRLTDDRLVDGWGECGRERYLDRFTPGAAIGRLESVYHELLSEAA